MASALFLLTKTIFDRRRKGLESVRASRHVHFKFYYTDWFHKSKKLFQNSTLFTYLLVLFTRWHPAKEACHQSSYVLPSAFPVPLFSCLSAPFATVASLHICVLKQSAAIAWLPSSLGLNLSLSPLEKLGTTHHVHMLMSICIDFGKGGIGAELFLHFFTGVLWSIAIFKKLGFLARLFLMQLNLMV